MINGVIVGHIRRVSKIHSGRVSKIHSGRVSKIHSGRVSAVILAYLKTVPAQ